MTDSLQTRLTALVTEMRTNAPFGCGYWANKLEALLREPPAAEVTDHTMTLRIEKRHDDQLEIDLHLCGEPARVIHALAHGLPLASLQEVYDALARELAAHAVAPEDPDA